MNKNILWLLGVLVSLSVGFASCSKDTEVVDPYADWAVRNDAYIDSIASVCQNPPSGESWKRVLNYKLQFDNAGGIVGGYVPNKNDYVYMKILPLDEGVTLGISPMSTDTVYTHYRGKLINGEVFNESFSGDWNPLVHEPISFYALGVVPGWTTALLQMQEGEHVELYIPAALGYGAVVKEGIPAYSALIFDLRLEKVVHPKGPDDRKLKKLEE